jgi:hypothetical protein
MFALVGLEMISLVKEDLLVASKERASYGRKDSECGAA